MKAMHGLYLAAAALCALCAAACDMDGELEKALHKGSTAEYTFYSDDPDTGSVSSRTQRYEIGSTLPASGLPSERDADFAAWKPGYRIDCWKFHSNPLSGSTVVPPSVTTVSDDDRTVVRCEVTAQPVSMYVGGWTAVTYTVRFDKNGGTGSVEPLSCTYDSPFTLPAGTALSRAGYTFAGWNTRADGNGAGFTAGASVRNLTTSQGATVTLYAKWTPITYTVRFNENGGTGTMPDQTLSYDSDAALRANAFTRPGHTFLGWSLSPVTATTGNSDAVDCKDRQSVRNLSDTQDAVVNLYAVWKEGIDIYFDPNGGSGSVSPVNVTPANSPVTLPSGSGLRRTGYTFAGWNTTAGGTGTTYAADGAFPYSPTLSADFTLYAKWEPITYTVRFNKNGGTGTMDAQTLSYDSAAALPANAFTRDGYTFLGWSRATGISNPVYGDGERVRNLASASGTAIDLYAQWIKIEVIKTQDYRIPPHTSGNAGFRVDASAGSVTFTASGGSSYVWGLDGAKKSTRASYTLRYTDTGRTGTAHTVTLLVSDGEDMPVYYYEVSVTISG